MSENKDYILGVNQTELDRLEFQHNVWRNVTDNFLDKIKIRNGWKCLDVGAGPGFVSADIRKLAGDEGEVNALEPSDFYLNYFKETCNKNNWNNIKFILGNLEDVEIEKNYYDLIFQGVVVCI